MNQSVDPGALGLVHSMQNAYNFAMTSARLAQYTAAPGQGASFIAKNRSSLAFILPLGISAEAWLRANTAEHATLDDDELVVEMRYFPDLADAIIKAGFLFERNAFPN